MPSIVSPASSSSPSVPAVHSQLRRPAPSTGSGWPGCGRRAATVGVSPRIAAVRERSLVGPPRRRRWTARGSRVRRARALAITECSKSPSRSAIGSSATVDARDGLGTRDHQDLVGVEGRVLGLPQRVGLVPAPHVGVDDGNERHRLARATAHVEEEGHVGGVQRARRPLPGGPRPAGRPPPPDRRRSTGRRSGCRSRPRRRRPGGPRRVAAARRSDRGGSCRARLRPRSDRRRRAR